MAYATGMRALFVCLGFMLTSNAVWGFGSIAVGAPARIEADGLAIGVSYGQETPQDAQALAIKRCKDFQDAPVETRDLCRVLETFSNQCVSVALDPKAGTPGWGWAVARESRDAEEGALRMCRSTAGQQRESYCATTNLRCDKTP